MTGTIAPSDSTITEPRVTDGLSQGELPSGPSALDNIDDPSFPPPLVDPAEIISGGPPPDGIPPIDDPRFVPVEEANQWLGAAEPVVYLEANGEVHAYPVQILIWHEIVNDTVGGIPVAVTYCPLCNSAVSYRREINGVTTTFGTSGRLFASALVMYDRATESLWTHFDGHAVVGVLTGETLDPIASPLLAWSDFQVAFPTGLVLDRDATGFNRPYGENPYDGYDNPSTNPFLFRGTVDDRAVAKQRVVGVAIGDQASAWTLDSVSGEEAKATDGVVGDTPIVILWKAGQASALDSARIVSGRDVGSVGVFSPVVDGQTLTFTADGGTFVDRETGSEWDITGRAVAGDLAGTALTQIHHLDTFWFAWSTYQPGTNLIDG
ncbi:MAG: DUF3179 domain-containing protein [Acidimicrobiia bacterium]|nr:DUF3179 domain-containing protein [Acidimicrobiia bacterium]